MVAYTAGNHAYEHMHEDEKYEKFAYSTHFAFSVVKEASTLAKGAYDSMLAVKRVGRDLVACPQRLRQASAWRKTAFIFTGGPWKA